MDKEVETDLYELILTSKSHLVLATLLGTLSVRGSIDSDAFKEALEMHQAEKKSGLK